MARGVNIRIEGRAQSAKRKAQRASKKKNLVNRSVPDSVEILSMAISL